MYRWVIMPYQEKAISGSSAILKGPRLRGGNKLMRYKKRWLSQALLPQVTVPGNGRIVCVRMLLILKVGTAGFEPTASGAPSKEKPFLAAHLGSLRLKINDLTVYK